MSTLQVLNELIIKKDGLSTLYKLGTITGYYNPADGKFYKESSYTTEIESASDLIYIDINKNSLYVWDDNSSKFIKITNEKIDFSYDATNEKVIVTKIE